MYFKGQSSQMGREHVSRIWGHCRAREIYDQAPEDYYFIT